MTDRQVTEQEELDALNALAYVGEGSLIKLRFGSPVFIGKSYVLEDVTMYQKGGYNGSLR